MPLSTLLIAGLTGIAALAAPHTDRDAVAQIDRNYQDAVKRNDAEAMQKILHPDFLLVLGDGRRFGRDDLLKDARRGRFIYELQDEVPDSQSVMVWGDTAIVTAKLRLKGLNDGKPFDRTLWFSDTYVRTDRGWRYLFGQASLPLPDEQGGQ
ncbi:MAG TPA: nuclear transport factor 2 family protein [Sphingomicrobium sp.]|jgi:ketosteroid isomerase-like protein|nr:nuclear transport factor 2 family protein [Sphingomicrobium sp.]